MTDNIHWRFGPGLEVPEPCRDMPHKQKHYEDRAYEFLEDQDMIESEWRRMSIGEQFALLADKGLLEEEQDDGEWEYELPEGIDD